MFPCESATTFQPHVGYLISASVSVYELAPIYKQIWRPQVGNSSFTVPVTKLGNLGKQTVKSRKEKKKDHPGMCVNDK